MIPRAQITAWRAIAPWSTDAQVEQDLILSRAITWNTKSFVLTFNRCSCPSRSRKERLTKGVLRPATDTIHPDAAYQQVHKALIRLLPGDAWKGTKQPRKRRT